MNLATIDPLRSSSGSLSGSSSSLLLPGLSSTSIGIYHLPDPFHVVVVDHVVLALPDQVPVDNIHPGVNSPHVWVQVNNSSLFFCPAVKIFHPGVNSPHVWVQVNNSSLFFCPAVKIF